MSCCVAVVFQSDARTLIPELARRCAVWVVDSAENRQGANDYWLRVRQVDEAMAARVTTFVRTDAASDQALDVVLELVEDHHGQFAQDPPVDEVLVIGLVPTQAVIAVLREWGYDQIETEGLDLKAWKGFLASRKALA